MLKKNAYLVLVDIYTKMLQCKPSTIVVTLKETRSRHMNMLLHTIVKADHRAVSID